MTAVTVRLRRMRALMRKETLQILRDRATLGMLLGVPLLQIIMFGFAIELTPNRLSITLVTAGATESRAAPLLRRLAGPAKITSVTTLDAARRAMARGTADLIIDDLHHPPAVYIDASNPIVATVSELRLQQFLRSIEAPIETGEIEPVSVKIERLYNGRVSTQPYLLTGLLGAIPTMSLVMMAALSVARERERGTIDVLRASSAQFVEIAAGKLFPYLILGLFQAMLILIVMSVLFHLGVHGSGPLLAVATIIFAVANLAVGFLFSCLARQQLQAAQLTFFFFLPSSLLSGFMFPFNAMPIWAQRIGETLPMTHYLRITRATMLRGVDSSYVLTEIMPILMFAALSLLGTYWVWCRDRSRDH